MRFLGEFAMKVLLFLIYTLGFTYFLFGIIDHLQKQERSVESLFWSATATLINTTLIASVLAMIGAYHLYLLLAIHALELIVIILISHRKNFLYSPKAFFLRLKSYDFKILPAVILVVALALYAICNKKSGRWPPFASFFLNPLYPNTD